MAEFKFKPGAVRNSPRRKPVCHALAGFKRRIPLMNSAANDLTLTLLIPGARGEVSDDASYVAAASAPELDLLLSRAQPAPVDAEFEQLVCRLFGVTLPPDADVPIAPLTYALDHGAPPAGYCMRVDPVHVVADRDVLRMLDPHTLAITPVEARDMVATLNAHFAQDGLQFIAPHPERWYLDLPTDPRLRTHPLARTIGASLHDFLPFGERGKHWQGVLNEIQMLLHEHPMNNAREARGALPINSVWFWGGGRLPALAPKIWAQVWSDEVAALGLAKLSQVPRSNAPESAVAWLREAITPGDHLLVLPAVTRAALAGMNVAWFAPLYAALKSRRLQRLTLHLANGVAYQVDAAALKRWWIRPRPLAQFLSALV